MNKELIINNMKEIIRAVPNTYAAYVANVTLKHIESAVDQYFAVREVEKAKAEAFKEGYSEKQREYDYWSKH